MEINLNGNHRLRGDCPLSVSKGRPFHSRHASKRRVTDVVQVRGAAKVRVKPLSTLMVQLLASLRLALAVLADRSPRLA